MKADDERLARLHEALVERVTELVSGEDFMAFVAESAKFHRYSPQNRLLIACQLIDRGVQPDGLTASYKTWEKIPAIDGGMCQVAKGEKAMWIYAPMATTRRFIDDATGDETVVAGKVRGFKPVAVFHQSQLEHAPALVEPPMPELLQGPDAPVRVWDAVAAELSTAGYAVGLVERGRGVSWNGQTDFTRREVRVHDDLAPAQRLKTLLHEWAHTTMGHDQPGRDRRVMEVEAESVAYLLCERVGVDSQQYTVPYVTGWAGNVDVVKSTAERVLATSSKLCDRLEARLAIDLTPDILTLSQTPPVAVTMDDSVVRAGDRLLPPERAELLKRSAPQRVASLLAAAGFDAGETAETFRQLGVDRQTASIAMTTIQPYAAVDRDAEPLYNPADARAALGDAYGAQHPSEGHGLRLIDKWSSEANTPHHRTTPPRPLTESVMSGTLSRIERP